MSLVDTIHSLTINKQTSIPKKQVQSLVNNKIHITLPYAIHDYSSHSGTFYPHNILVNNPKEELSRWTSKLNDQSQYITIKLEKPAIACEILFGKYHKGHVCNLKEFIVWGGLELNEMKEILHKGLVNDSQPEEFSLRYTYNDLIFPIQYLKIVPMATYGTSFNYSIWYIEVKGINDESIMTDVYHALSQYKDIETIRLCLKHFRQKNMMDVYYVLQNKTDIQLEHPLIADLHQSLVVDGDFAKAEDIVLSANKQNMFLPYLNQAVYTPNWHRIKTDEDCLPKPRGGHQMCLDEERQKIYLFGGWDGEKDLADFWCYSIKGNSWKCISKDTERQDGPSARSCHTIGYDPVMNSIYVLGRYMEKSTDVDVESNYDPDFYQYFVDLDKWVKISESTQTDGGPPLLHDHQMLVDRTSRNLYVFGGLAVSRDHVSTRYGGFYAYNMDKSTWSIIRPNQRRSLGIYIGQQHTQSMKARSGHTMLLDECNRKIYIFAGKRDKHHLSDLYCYSIDDDKLIEVSQDFIIKDQGLLSGYTQRATLCTTNQEIYVYSGILWAKNHRVTDQFWVYDIKKNTWEKVYENHNEDSNDWSQSTEGKPCPRFAHQMVYNPQTQSHYIFGGNPGDYENQLKRLNDFWELKLKKPDSTQIIRRCQCAIRCRKLHELCMMVPKTESLEESNKATMAALHYLRDSVTPFVDYENKEEVDQLKELCKYLCLSEDNDSPSKDNFSFNLTHLLFPIETDFEERTHVFQTLLKYFPAEMKEPDGVLADVVKIV
ncbi:Muskelin N-terminus-domain-containing protein [Pilobolus umbonatus]|nr:Muskelin N-terminus-domain-containing protein [Pilobolus umbonatus]